MKCEKEAYILILTTQDYLTGLKVTYRSLRRFSDKEVVVLVNKGISENIREELSKSGMRVICVGDIQIPGGIFSEKMQADRWRHTLFKLRVFGRTEYDKLIYLDSDLLVCGNIDSLFEREGLCAVSDAEFFPQYERGGINAGVFCFRPSKELEQTLIDTIPMVAKKMEVFGDQDVINAHFDTWESETAQHLSVAYNACFYQLDEYNGLEPLVVHFILGSKPWMWSKGLVWMKGIKWLVQGKKKQWKYLKEYVCVLKSER